MLVAQDVSVRATVVAAPNQVSSELAGEAVILHVDRGLYFGLDEVGARVWSLIQQPQTIAALRDAIMDEYQVSAERCEHDLLALIAKLAHEGLVTVTDATAK